MKKLKKLLFLFIFIFFAGILHSEEIPTLNSGGDSPYASFLYDVPPQIDDVKISPKTPKENQDIEIIAKIYNNPELTDFSKVVKSSINYSVDGGKTYIEIPMIQDTKDFKIWRGKIPGQKKGTKIICYLKAVDSTENIALEIPFKNTTFSLDTINLMEILKDADDADCEVLKDIDLLSCSVGYDDNYLYGKMVVEGKFVKTNKETGLLCGYLFVMANCDITLRTDLMNALVFAYAPAATMMGYPPYGLVNTAFFSKGMLKEGEPEIILDRKKSPNTLYFKFKRNVIGKNKSNALKVACATAAINISDPQPYPWDATSYCLFYMRGHEIEVK